MNNHVEKIACQTCYITEMARGSGATKIDWHWRTASKLKDGEGYKDYYCWSCLS